MIHHFLLVVVLGIVTICNAQDQDSFFNQPLTGDNANLNAIQAYEQTFVCTEFSDSYWRDIAQQCDSVCVMNRADGQPADPNAGRWVEGSVSCVSDSEWVDFRSGQPSNDRSHKLVRGGHCMCNLAIIEELGDFFVQSVKVIGESLKEWVCPFIKALEIVIQVAEMAIPGPGKAITTGMRTAIASAKAFKYAYEGQDAAREWANYLLGGIGLSESMGCGKVPSLDDLITAFVPFSDSRPDIYADFSSIPGGPGCMGKGKKGDGKKCDKDNENQSQSPDQNTDKSAPTQSDNVETSAPATPTPTATPSGDPKTSNPSTSTPNPTTSERSQTSTSAPSVLKSTPHESQETSSPATSTLSLSPSEDTATASQAPSTLSDTSTTSSSSTASTSIIENKTCTYYKPKSPKQRVMMKRQYSDFLRTVGDSSQPATKVAVQTGQTVVQS